VAVVALVVAVVLFVGRRILLVGDLFPELQRIPLVRRLVPAGTAAP